MNDKIIRILYWKLENHFMEAKSKKILQVNLIESIFRYLVNNYNQN